MNKSFNMLRGLLSSKRKLQVNKNDLAHDSWMESENSRHNRLWANREKRVSLSNMHSTIATDPFLSHKDKKEIMEDIRNQINKLTIEMIEILKEPK